LKANYPMNETTPPEEPDEEYRNPLLKRLYARAKTSRIARFIILVMIIDEPILLLILAYNAYF